MPEYYAVVWHNNKIVPELSGKIEARSGTKATIEAKIYSEQVNGGWPLEVLLGEFYLVVACTYNQVSKYRGYTKFKKNKLTIPKEF